MELARSRKKRRESALVHIPGLASFEKMSSSHKFQIDSADIFLENVNSENRSGENHEDLNRIYRAKSGT